MAVKNASAAGSGLTLCFTLPRARQVAETRLARLAQCLDWLVEESFGIL